MAKVRRAKGRRRTCPHVCVRVVRARVKGDDLCGVICYRSDGATERRSEERKKRFTGTRLRSVRGCGLGRHVLAAIAVGREGRLRCRRTTLLSEYIISTSLLRCHF